MNTNGDESELKNQGLDLNLFEIDNFAVIRNSFTYCILDSEALFVFPRYCGNEGSRSAKRHTSIALFGSLKAQTAIFSYSEEQHHQQQQTNKQTEPKQNMTEYNVNARV